MLLYQTIQSKSTIYMLYRARARPRIPAAPARLIAIPPVAAGAPAVDVEEPPVVDPEAEAEELLSEEEAEVVVVMVMVEVAMEDEPEESVRGIDEAAVLLAPLALMEPVMEPMVGKSLPYKLDICEASAIAAEVCQALTLSGRLLYQAG
jgi:hypothetical protein